MFKDPKYKPDEYQALADCIRSDQLSAKQVYETMQTNSEFAKWYEEKYLKDVK